MEIYKVVDKNYPREKFSFHGDNLFFHGDIFPFHGNGPHPFGHPAFEKTNPQCQIPDIADSVKVHAAKY